MNMGPTPLIRGMQRLAAGLEAALEASRAIHHNLAAGEAREHTVAEHLAPHIPARFRMSSGIVVNALGEESRQQDVLITDPSNGTPFVAEGNIGVHPIETVTATLQIKTSIGPGDLRDAVENVVSVKRLLPDTPRGFSRLSGDRLELGQAVMKPFAGIVAFQSTGSIETLRRAYLQANHDVPPANRCNVLFVLDQFVTAWSPDGSPLSLSETPTDSGHAQTLAAGRDSILFFYVLLIKALNGYEPPPFELSAYLNAQMPPVTVFRDQM
jgi:hypothetical protein